MIVHIPTPLRSYTGERATVEASGATLGAVLRDLDHQFPGMRFRILDEAERVRRHIKLFVGKLVTDALDQPVADAGEVHIVCALSGG